MQPELQTELKNLGRREGFPRSKQTLTISSLSPNNSRVTFNPGVCWWRLSQTSSPLVLALLCGAQAEPNHQKWPAVAGALLATMQSCPCRIVFGFPIFIDPCLFHLLPCNQVSSLEIQDVVWSWGPLRVEPGIYTGKASYSTILLYSQLRIEIFFKNELCSQRKLVSG